jgi:mRNA interferase RelE/StbE
LARVEWAEEAIRDLEKLDDQVRQTVLKKLVLFSKNFERLVPEPLSGVFKGAYKLRVGDWRVVYTMKAKL